MKNKKLSPTEQAKILYNKVRSIYKAYDYNNGICDITEPEVKFRYDSIHGLLLMLHNDVSELYLEWKREDEKQKITCSEDI